MNTVRAGLARWRRATHWFCTHIGSPLTGSSLQTPKHPVFARRILKAQDPQWSSYRNVNVPPHRLLTLSAIFGAASLACLPSEGRR